MNLHTYTTLPSSCPVCGAKPNRASLAYSSSGEIGEPRSGDVSICLQCGAVNIYADYFGHIRKITSEEERELFGDPNAGPAVARMVEFIKNEKK